MSTITQFLISHGGPLLFLIAFAEQSGLPIPGAPWLLAAGALAATGQLGLTAVVCWAAVGSIAADTTWFYLGRRGTGRIFTLFPRLRAVRSKLCQATRTRSLLRGAWMLTVAKFLPFGTVVPLHAGALKVASWRFLLVDALCSIIYASAYILLGFSFHNQLEQVVACAQKLGLVAFLLVLSAVVACLGWAILKRHSKAPAHLGGSRLSSEEPGYAALSAAGRPRTRL